MEGEGPQLYEDKVFIIVQWKPPNEPWDAITFSIGSNEWRRALFGVGFP